MLQLLYSAKVQVEVAAATMFIPYPVPVVLWSILIAAEDTEALYKLISTQVLATAAVPVSALKWVTAFP